MYQQILLPAMLLSLAALPMFKAQHLTGFSLQFNDMMAPTVPPYQVLTVPSMLDCGRACLKNASCVSFTLDRNAVPMGDTTCQLYNVQPSLQYDDTKITYFTNGNSLPTQ